MYYRQPNLLVYTPTTIVFISMHRNRSTNDECRLTSLTVLSPNDITVGLPSLDATPDFTSKRKSMSIIVSNYKNNRNLLLEGAQDQVLLKRTSMKGLKGAHPLPSADKDNLFNKISHLVSKRLCCLAISEVKRGGALANFQFSLAFGI